MGMDQNLSECFRFWGMNIHVVVAVKRGTFLFFSPTTSAVPQEWQPGFFVIFVQLGFVGFYDA